MNNLAFGGTRDSGSRRDRHGAARPLRSETAATQFSYYETIAGGAGAGPSHDGASAVHTHMTNTMNTPIEALEAQLPVRVVRYAVRSGSGGRGTHRGGDGIVREIEFLTAAQLTLLTERRSIAPYGAAGGVPGRVGVNEVVRAGRAERLPSKVTLTVEAGDRVRIQTPGGGGWGRRRRRR
jgi:N-methylhydantoinase B